MFLILFFIDTFFIAWSEWTIVFYNSKDKGQKIFKQNYVVYLNDTHNTKLIRSKWNSKPKNKLWTRDMITELSDLVLIKKLNVLNFRLYSASSTNNMSEHHVTITKNFTMICENSTQNVQNPQWVFTVIVKPHNLCSKIHIYLNKKNNCKKRNQNH